MTKKSRPEEASESVQVPKSALTHLNQRGFEDIIAGAFSNGHSKHAESLALLSTCVPYMSVELRKVVALIMWYRFEEPPRVETTKERRRRARKNAKTEAETEDKSVDETSRCIKHLIAEAERVDPEEKGHICLTVEEIRSQFPTFIEPVLKKKKMQKKKRARSFFLGVGLPSNPLGKFTPPMMTSFSRGRKGKRY